MRDRLIQLLKKADKYASGICTDYDEAQEICAEYLISEGVIVPSVETAVDFVEVVRCKDCAKDGLSTCPICYIENHTLQFINHDPDFFCGYGEKK